MSIRRTLYVLPSLFFHAFSLDTDGSTESLVDFTATVFGVANAWTLSFWCKLTDLPSGNNELFHMRPAATLTSEIFIRLDGNVANDPLVVFIRDSAAAVIKQYSYDSQVSSAWANYVLTWDGTTMVFYKNGIALTPTAITTDTTGTMADTGRRFSVGCSQSGTLQVVGLYHSVAMWNDAATSGQVALLYNSGAGNAYNVRNILPSNLVLWTQFGFADADLFHNEAGTLDYDGSANITSADRVAQSPG